MNTPTMLVVVLALVLSYRVLMFALRRKGDLRAGGSVGRTTFYLEVSDKTSAIGRRGTRVRRQPTWRGAQNKQMSSSG